MVLLKNVILCVPLLIMIVNNISILSFIFVGLFLGLCILQTPNLTKRKKILRFVSVFFFVVILGTGLYQNIYESLEKGIFSSECSLFDYEKMCQAKCYCRLSIANVSNPFYKNCKAYDICHACEDGQNTTAKYCSYLRSNLQIG